MSGAGGTHLQLVREDDSGSALGLQAPVTVAGARPRVLLVGDMAARPDGLERALMRAGFEIAEASVGTVRDLATTDAVLVSAPNEAAAVGSLSALATLVPAGLPILVTLEAGDRAALVRLFARGAADVLFGPPAIDPAELCARLIARLRAGEETVRARRLAEQTSELFNAFQDIAIALRPEETLHSLVQHLGQVLELSHCACVLWTPNQTGGRVVALHENPRLRDEPVSLTWYPEAKEAIRTDATVFVPEVATEPMFHEVRELWRQAGLLPDVRSAAAIPLSRHGWAVGAVVLRTGLGAALSAEQLRFAERLVRGTTRVLESQERRAAILRRQGLPEARDPVTGCASLDALDRRLQEEVERARRYGLSFSLVLLDLDGLALVNLRYGMETGDRVLAEIGTILQREIRAPDFVARFGGDEFALILPETTVDGARRSIRRIRDRIAQHQFASLAPSERPFLSAGIVAYPHPATLKPQDLFALAEAALVRAKSESREGERMAVAEEGGQADRRTGGQ